MDFNYPNNNWKTNCHLTQNEEEEDANPRFRVLLIFF